MRPCARYLCLSAAPARAGRSIRRRRRRVAAPAMGRWPAQPGRRRTVAAPAMGRWPAQRGVARRPGWVPSRGVARRRILALPRIARRRRRGRLRHRLLRRRRRRHGLGRRQRVQEGGGCRGRSGGGGSALLGEGSGGLVRHLTEPRGRRLSSHKVHLAAAAAIGVNELKGLGSARQEALELGVHAVGLRHLRTELGEEHLAPRLAHDGDELLGVLQAGVGRLPRLLRRRLRCGWLWRWRRLGGRRSWRGRTRRRSRRCRNV